MTRAAIPPESGHKISRDAMRERIVDAAKSLFEEKGADGISMRAIASRVGIPTMTLYGYFASKTAIIRGLWSFAFAPVFAEMRHAEEAIADPAERLTRVAHIYVDYWICHPDRYRMVFMIEDRREGGDPSWFIDETEVSESYLRLGPMIAAARGTPDADCRADAEALICALTGIAHMAITVSEYPWARPGDYVDRILAAFVR
ncbi:MAG TPA: TetR/AcrR family transcriptional regulator [Sphingopyxis sp.]|nr:TetR/AcrR family transcriptional regulator [Sphingopyxis sp.]HMP43559.1 TetR/AcrR family transcriptional regulator [Sphingopyxis sp.]HMQ17639.1 TetR/AcrR family transcriptional regulator [Sphingopyxis sp.]